MALQVCQGKKARTGVAAGFKRKRCSWQAAPGTCAQARVPIPHRIRLSNSLLTGSAARLLSADSLEAMSMAAAGCYVEH